MNIFKTIPQCNKTTAIYLFYRQVTRFLGIKAYIEVSTSFWLHGASYSVTSFPLNIPVKPGHARGKPHSVGFAGSLASENTFCLPQWTLHLQKSPGFVPPAFSKRFFPFRLWCSSTDDFRLVQEFTCLLPRARIIYSNSNTGL